MRRPFRADEATRRARAFVRGHGEQLTASAVSSGGIDVVTTEHALYVGDRRLPWDRIAKATWDAGESALVVVGSTAPGAPVERLVIGLDEPGALVERVRIAVIANIVVSRRIESPGRGGAWVTARRVPGRQYPDEVRWTVVFDPGLDPGDPALRAWADQHVAALRESTGV